MILQVIFKSALSMKDITLILLHLLVASFALQAQEFKKFRVGLAAGYAVDTHQESENKGVIISLEPSYRIKENVSVGLRLETTILNTVENDIYNLSDMYFSGVHSYGLTGQYYFKSHGMVRPFVGFGVGGYSPAKAGGKSLQGDMYIISKTISAGKRIGFNPRVGLDVRHFSLFVEYNFGSTSIQKLGYTYADGSSQNFEREISNNYFGIKAGFFFGGGPRTTRNTTSDKS
jgi:hypothetical protein